jgi:carboxylate-amine ligase
VAEPGVIRRRDEQRVARGIENLLRRGTGADLQRRLYRETGGDLRAVVRAAVEVTAETFQAGHRSTG